MMTSTKGLENIKKEEGFVSHPYNDVVGFSTIGFGHKITPVDNFTLSGITEARACNILIEDCHHVEFFLNKYLEEIHATINQNQFDALVDFGFNLGVGALHQLLSHGINGVPFQILRWTHAGGKVLQNLKDRRGRELALWNTPVVEVVKEKE